MNEKYIGKVCPYCKTAFTEQDEIVICSACDMPHHKDCWIENQGCTTFGCSGTIEGLNDMPNSVTMNQMQYQPYGQPYQQPYGQPQQPAYRPPVQQPVYQQPQQPAYRPPVQQPVYQQPQQPAYRPPVQQPVYQQPQQPAYRPPVQQPAQPAPQQPVQQPQANGYRPPVMQNGQVYCTNCQTINRHAGAFCARCGAPLKR